jgi:hypothetical protein
VKLFDQAEANRAEILEEIRDLEAMLREAYKDGSHDGSVMVKVISRVLEAARERRRQREEEHWI